MYKKKKEVKNGFIEGSCEDFERLDILDKQSKDGGHKDREQLEDNIKQLNKMQELDEILKKHRKAEFNAKVLENGRITIPNVERELNDIQKGDYVSVTVEKIQRNKR